jgi:phosphate transport system permease protein
MSDIPPTPPTPEASPTPTPPAAPVEGVAAPPPPKPLSRPPTPLERGFDIAFRKITWVVAWASVIMMLLIVLRLVVTATPALRAYGLSMLVSTEWNENPEHQEFGILPQIWGTLYSSILALLIGTVFGLAVAIFLSEDYLPARWQMVFKNVIELLAAIPSVIYGLWGIYVVIPALQGPASWVGDHLGWIPFFDKTNFLGGKAILPASLVLAIMILPTITALSRDALTAVPYKLREGAVGLGATRWETILRIILPTASTGIFGAVILAFGRALGETMALAMLVGSKNVLSLSVLSPADTLAALMANNFSEAPMGSMKMSALMFAALVLLAITLLVNVIGAAIIERTSAQFKGLR